MEIYHFNPRPPQGERPASARAFQLSIIFQSTPPARGATLQTRTINVPEGISIHAPRKGSDFDLSTGICEDVLFQSTPPARGATCREGVLSLLGYISIHAPRKGSDNNQGVRFCVASYFNPRPPQGERPISDILPFSLSPFQSTPPARGAT